MAFSTILRASLLALVGVTYVVCKIPNVGKKLDLASVQKDIDFKKYALENDGVWKFQMVPNVSFFKSVKKMWLVNKETDTEGVFRTTIYYKTQAGKTKTFMKEKITDISKGKATATAKDVDGTEITFTISFVKYEPSSYLYYLVTSDDGEDTSTDYRYVLAHKSLSDNALQSIKQLDKKLGFANTLKKIEL